MNVILIDDEQLAIDFLQRQLGGIDRIHIIGTYVNPKEGLEAILQNEVDVVFLDIHMPSIDGVNLARQILEKKPHVLIVFVTAFEQYAVDAFEIDAADYLIKPIQFDRLKATVKRLRTKSMHVRQEQLENEPLRLFMCKQFRIEKGNEPQGPITWRTARAKELFLFLLQNRNKVVHKEHIAELLWPDTDLEKAFTQLYTTVYHVRNVIKKHLKGHFRLENATSGYVLYMENVELDVQVWEEAVKSLPSLREETLPTYEKVMNMYSEPYLSEHHYLWALPEAERLDQIWVNIALKIGSFLQRKGDTKAAYEWNKYICTRYPSVEEAHFAVMKQLAKEGKSLYVHQQYVTLEDALEEELGLEPSAYVAKWYADWIKQDRLNI